MNTLYVMYGAATVAVSLAIDVADCAQDHKASAVIVDYMIVTYLFFFNSWFRNRMVLRSVSRIGED